MRFISIIALFMLSFASPLSAQTLTPSLSALYFKEGTRRAVENTTDPSDSTREQNSYTFLSLGVCYRLDSICLGLKYLQGEIETKVASNSRSDTSKASFTAPGLTVGYSGTEGFVAHATWLISAKKTLINESTTYFAKSAWVAELGYGFSLNSVRIGPLFGIYSFEWREKELAGNRVNLSPSETDDFILPQLALWVDL